MIPAWLTATRAVAPNIRRSAPKAKKNVHTLCRTANKKPVAVKIPIDLQVLKSPRLGKLIDMWCQHPAYQMATVPEIKGSRQNLAQAKNL
jgi:hypothetical protein